MSPRKFKGQILEFGTSGYTKDNVFVLYDRNSNSVWWPLKGGGFDAVAGKKRGQHLPFTSKPKPQTLASWSAKHPNTLVLLPPPPSPRQLQRRQRRRESGLVGRWALNYEWMGQARSGELVFGRDKAGSPLHGRWIDAAWECPLSDIEVGRARVSFYRGRRSGGKAKPALRFDGERSGSALTGSILGLGQETLIRAEKKPRP